MQERLPQPPESFREQVRYEDGELYWTDHIENRIRKDQHLPIASKVKKRSIRRAEVAGYKQIPVGKQRYQLHRVIWWLHHGTWYDYIDHIDGDIHNNRIGNLRPCEGGANRVNIVSKLSIKTRHYPRTGKTSYECRINIDSTTYHIGTYHDYKLALYASWKIRDLLYPGFPPVPEEIKAYIERRA